MNRKERKGINSNLLLVISIPLLVAIGVLAGGFITDANPQIGSGSQASAAQVTEQTVTLEEFLLNLESPKNNHNYIRLQVTLSSRLEGGEERINENLDKIRDSLIHTVSRLTVDDVYNDEVGTQKLKEVLKKSLNDLFEDPIIDDVYITNIVVQ